VTYFANPRLYDAEEVVRKGGRCAIGGERPDPTADPGWVRCPLVGEDFICLGCCYDLQYRSRSDDPLGAGSPFAGIPASAPPASLVTACLDHQERLLVAERPSDGRDRALEEVRAARARWTAAHP
jgi:hypothetical protein